MAYKLVLFLFLFSFSTTSLLAQKDKKEDVQVIEFGDDNNNSSTNKASDIIIKTNPFSYLFGWQFLEVEKYVTSFITVQGGIGLTFKSLLATDNYSEVLAELSSIPNCESAQWGDNDYCDDFFDTSIRNQKVGLVFNTSIRLYFDDDAPDGSYFSFTTRFSNKKYDVQQIIQNSSSIERIPDEYQPEKVRNIDLVGNYGYQYLYDNLTTEYFIGLGLRLTKQTRQDIGQNDIGLFQSGEQQFKRSVFRFEAGVRVGFQL